MARDPTYTSVLSVQRESVEIGMGYSENRMCSSVKLTIVLHDDAQHCVLGLVQSNDEVEEDCEQAHNQISNFSK